MLSEKNTTSENNKQNTIISGNCESNCNQIEKDKLALFEKNIENASNIKKQIKENINLIINELKAKIENVEKIEKKFFESLEIEVKFSNLLYENYLQELKNNN